MAIITFKSNEIKETGQTLSVAAVATQIAIEHNYKVLLVSTNFNLNFFNALSFLNIKFNHTAILFNIDLPNNVSTIAEYTTDWAEERFSLLNKLESTPAALYTSFFNLVR